MFWAVFISPCVLVVKSRFALRIGKKKVPTKKLVLRNRRPPEALNDTKLILNACLGPIWYHSEPSNVPYSPNQFLGLGFFAVSHSKPALVACS